MDIEDLPRRAADLLKAVETEDLDRYSLAELDDRISRLEAEIARVRAKRASSATQRSAADALFRR